MCYPHCGRMLVPEVARRLGDDTDPTDPRADALVAAAISCFDAATDSWIASDGAIPWPLSWTVQCLRFPTWQSRTGQPEPSNVSPRGPIPRLTVPAGGDRRRVVVDSHGEAITHGRIARRRVHGPARTA
jgi:hypothetical protein